MSEVKIKMLRAYTCPGKGLLDKGKQIVTEAQAEFLVNRGVAEYADMRPAAPAPVAAPEPQILAPAAPLAFVEEVTHSEAEEAEPEDDGGEEEEDSGDDRPRRKRRKYRKRDDGGETPED